MKRSPLLPVGLFTVSYLLIAGGFAVNAQNWEFAFYIAVVILIGALVVLLHRRIGLSQGLLWGLSIWGLLHMIGGLVPTSASWPINGEKHVFYSLWIIQDYLKFDHVVHTYGFFLATIGAWEVLRFFAPKMKATTGVLIFCALIGMGLGAVNEVVEFTAVLLVPDTNVGGYNNTGWDLVSNMAGAILAAFLIKV